MYNICWLTSESLQRRGAVHRFLWLVVALPFLPPEQIEETYHYLDQRVKTAELNQFMD